MSVHKECRLINGGQPVADPLSSAERARTDILFSLYEAHQRGTLGKEESSIKNTQRALRAAVQHIKLPPWAWNPSHIDDYLSFRALELAVSSATQSIHISALRMFQNYLLSDIGLCNEIHRDFGMRPAVFVTAENAICYKRKSHQHRYIITPLTPEQCAALIREFDFAIQTARELGLKSYKTLQRDKTITAVFLHTGLRAEELASIHLRHFMGDRKYPAFGRFAILRVIGKGRKERTVRLYNPTIRDLLEWYLENVRPGFLTRQTDDPHLLFYSERGTALCERQYRRALKHMGHQAGIPMKLHPHLLRHTYATQMASVIGPEALQKQLGHTFLSTTLCTYYHQDPDTVGNEVVLGIEKMAGLIDAMTEEYPDECDD